MTVFSRPEVEEKFGARRREWRDNRRAFRDALVQIDAQREDPPVPNALGSHSLSSATNYLDDAHFSHIDQLDEASCEKSEN